MPVEREFKYVLRDAGTLWAILAPMAAGGMIHKADIRQGYLSRGGRIRSRDWFHEDQPEYIFTYKHDLRSQPGCLEIETQMSKEDFDLAWSEADHKIDKMRFLLPALKGKGVWEVDFFRDSQGIYLAMAEFEVPANSGPPDRLHPLVEEYLVFAVPEDDGRFKNRKLCRRELVEPLLREIV